MVEKGVIINFTNDGEISSDLTSLAKEEEEAMSVVAFIRYKPKPHAMTARNSTTTFLNCFFCRRMFLFDSSSLLF
mgnify:CR=1 FL=1